MTSETKLRILQVTATGGGALVVFSNGLEAFLGADEMLNMVSSGIGVVLQAGKEPDED